MSTNNTQQLPKKDLLESLRKYNNKLLNLNHIKKNDAGDSSVNQHVDNDHHDNDHDHFSDHVEGYFTPEVVIESIEPSSSNSYLDTNDFLKHSVSPAKAFTPNREGLFNEIHFDAHEEKGPTMTPAENEQSLMISQPRSLSGKFSEESSDLREKINDRLDENNELRKQIEELERKLSEGTRSINKANASMNDSQKSYFFDRSHMDITDSSFSLPKSREDSDLKKSFEIIVKLKSKLTKEKERYDSLERRKDESIKMMNKLVEHFKTENLRLSQQLDLVRKSSDYDVEELNQQILELKNTNLSLIEEINSLRSSRGQEQEKNDLEVERQIKEKVKLQSDIVELKKDNLLLKEKIHVLEETVKDIESKRNELIHQYEQQEIPSWRKKYDALEVSAKELQNKLEEYRNDKEKSLNEVKERYKTKEQMLNENIKRLEEELQHQREQHKQAITSLMEEKKDAEMQLQEQVNITDDSRVQLLSLKSSLEDIESNILNHLLQEQEQLAMDLSEFESFVSDYCSNRARKEIQKLTTELIELRNQISLATEQSEILRKQLSISQTELEETNAAFLKCDQTLSQMESQRKAQAERHKLELEEVRNEFKNQIFIIKSEKESLAEMLNQTKNQLNSVQIKSDQCQKEKLEIQQEIVYLRKRNNELEATFSTIDSERQRLQSENGALSRSVEQLKESMELKNEEYRALMEHSRSSIQALQLKLNREQQLFQKYEYENNLKFKNLNESIVQIEGSKADLKKKQKEELQQLNNEISLKQRQIENLNAEISKGKHDLNAAQSQFRKELEGKEQEIQKIKRERQQLEHSLVIKEREKESLKLRLEMMERELERTKSLLNK
ncbi:hypothetical protein FDP41_001693 [Naegleria fowleri]|uniref:Uncharacterized protein n=1 Tax=Naegleria fowleri TaxID=5763 RepID=A0A6A5C0H7_NAEFO|nr:uncharacterized protein FDP41_001693 [Naegleria fowleri]KAF0979350.1 hypothetical protein FDP41_001693 [Naegleria fowleri]CAG4715725.1 unnamed protein product [Naegleria fowleri]